MGSAFFSLGEQIPPDEQNQWLGTERGFWADDYLLAVFFTCLGETVDAIEAPDPWLLEFRRCWIDLTIFAGTGMCPTSSEDYLTTQERRGAFLELIHDTLSALMNVGGDYWAYCPDLKPECTCDDCQQPPKLAQQIGVIEIGAAIARILVGWHCGGEASKSVVGRNRWAQTGN